MIQPRLTHFEHPISKYHQSLLVNLEYIIIGILLLALIVLGIRFILLRIQLEERARSIHERWRENDLHTISKSIKANTAETIRKEVEIQSREWQQQEEERIRRDAIRRSREVIHGKVTEHLIPFFRAFPWNPADARFLGSPIDFVVFDGLSEGAVREVILVEVKSGSRKVLSARERSVEHCIKRGDVSFRILHPDDK